MPRVLIAGCGYVGQATADLFHAAGWSVEGLTASRSSAAELADKPFPVRACDIADRSAVAAIGAEFDTIVQCVSSRGGGEDDYRRIYCRGAENLIAVFPSARLIFTSSTAVYTQRAAEWVTEQSPAELNRATAQVLRETEQLVLANGGVVARVAGIYGPDRSFLLQKFLSGEAIVPTNDRFINQVHRDDVAAALFLLGTRRDIRSEIFNVVDDAPLTKRECFTWLADYFHRPVPPIGSEATSRKRGESNKRVSNAKLRGVGWRPRYQRFEIGMRESVIPAWEK